MRGLLIMMIVESCLSSEKSDIPHASALVGVAMVMSSYRCRREYMDFGED